VSDSTPQTGSGNPLARKRPYGVFDVLLHVVFWTIYGLVKYIPPPIGDGLRSVVLRVFARSFRTWHIREGVTVWYPHRLKVGRHSSLNEWVYIIATGGVTIGEGVRIAARSSILTVNHVFEDPNLPIHQQGWDAKPIVIKDDVWLGINSVILSGVTVGRGAVVSAGAVVVDDVPARAVVGGVPARVISWRGERPEDAVPDDL
jgi:acetyltransferase-like isoleucine patch superfamily enzyme